jgi:uncharacterized protein (DUF58 family)
MSRVRELALTGALLCATAAAVGVPALYAPGIAALLATGLAPLWVAISARRCELSLSCAALTVQEDERVEVLVTVRRGVIPFPGGTLMTWPGAQELALARTRAFELAGQAIVSRRGRHTVGPARMHVEDPFGLCSKERTSAGPELLVLPRIHRLDGSALAFLEGVGRSSPESPQGLDSLQPHRPGSPASRIHWPTVARSGVLMERSMRAEDDPRILVELDASRPGSEEALDSAVRAAASLCLYLAHHGGCLVLLAGEHRPTVLGPDLQTWPSLHARMALLASGAAVHRVPGAQRRLSVIRVTAGREANGSEAGEPHCRISPHPLPGLPTLFELAGCSAQYLDGRLGQLAA